MATPENYTLSLHDALPISLDPVDCTKYRANPSVFHLSQAATITGFTLHDTFSLEDSDITIDLDGVQQSALACQDRKSTRLNSSHSSISYAVFCLKKKTDYE